MGLGINKRTANKVLPKAGVMCYYDSLVLTQTLVCQIPSSADMPRLRQYPNVMGNGNLHFVLLSYICGMTSLTDIKDTLKSNKQRLTDKYGLSFMAIFGSYGRGQQTESSDIDILVDFQKPVGIEFIDLANELEKLLKIKVDLVSKNGVRPQYLKQIEQDLNYV